MRRVIAAPVSGAISTKLCEAGRSAVCWLPALALLMGAWIFSAGNADAGEIKAQKLVGAWQFSYSIDTRKDGIPFDRWGPTPTGMLIFDAAGYYSQMITSQDRIFGAKIVASFGKFSIEPGGKAILTKIEGSTSIKAVGTTQRRIILSLTENELRYLIEVTSTDSRAEVVWKRLKSGDEPAVR